MNRKEILTAQIFRLARIFKSRSVCPANNDWHMRVLTIQTDAIKEKRALK